MQKKTNAKTVGAVHTHTHTHTHTQCLYKISVQVKGRKLENKKVIKTIRIDEAKTYEKVVGF